MKGGHRTIEDDLIAAGAMRKHPELCYLCALRQAAVSTGGGVNVCEPCLRGLVASDLEHECAAPESKRYYFPHSVHCRCPSCGP